VEVIFVDLTDDYLTERNDDGTKQEIFVSLGKIERWILKTSFTETDLGILRQRNNISFLKL
jgi:hypothetical protein